MGSSLVFDLLVIPALWALVCLAAMIGYTLDSIGRKITNAIDELRYKMIDLECQLKQIARRCKQLREEKNDDL